MKYLSQVGFLALVAARQRAGLDESPYCETILGFSEAQSTQWCQTRCSDSWCDTENCPGFDEYKRFCMVMHWTDEPRTVDSCFTFARTLSNSDIKAEYTKAPTTKAHRAPATCQNDCQESESCVAFQFLIEGTESTCYLLNETQAEAFVKDNLDTINDTSINGNLCTGDAECIQCKGVNTAAIVDQDAIFGWKWCRKQHDHCKIGKTALSFNPFESKYC